MAPRLGTTDLEHIECRLEGFSIIVQNIAGRKLSTVYANQKNLNGKLRKKLGAKQTSGRAIAHPGPP